MSVIKGTSGQEIMSKAGEIMTESRMKTPKFSGFLWQPKSLGMRTRRKKQSSVLPLMLPALARQDYDSTAVLEIIRRTLY